MMSKIKPRLTPAERKTLEQAGLIRLEKRSRAQHVVLEDKAWDWAVENYDVELSLSQYAVPVLQKLLVKLGQYLRSHSISLADCLTVSPAPEPTPDDKTASGTHIEERIREAYAQIPASSSGFRVRLLKLRSHLDDVSPRLIDETLSKMQRRGELSLMPMEDPQEISSEDEEAAIDVGGGDKRYFVYIKQ